MRFSLHSVWSFSAVITSTGPCPVVPYKDKLPTPFAVNHLSDPALEPQPLWAQQHRGKHPHPPSESLPGAHCPPFWILLPRAGPLPWAAHWLAPLAGIWCSAPHHLALCRGCEWERWTGLASVGAAPRGSRAELSGRSMWNQGDLGRKWVKRRTA